MTTREISAAVRQVPVADGLFTWPSDEPRLIGGRCSPCGQVAFPRAASCPRCGSQEVSTHELPRTGTVWTFTTQDFTPKEPYIGDAERFVVGYVALGHDCMVEARLLADHEDDVRIDAPVELRIVPLTTTGDAEILTFAFALVDEVAS